MSTTTFNQWVIRAKQKDGGEVTFNLGGTEQDAAGAQATFEASHGKRYEFLEATPVGEGRSALFVVPEVIPVPVEEAVVVAPAVAVTPARTPIVPPPVKQVSKADDHELTDDNDDTAFGVKVV